MYVEPGELRVCIEPGELSVYIELGELTVTLINSLESDPSPPMS